MPDWRQRQWSVLLQHDRQQRVGKSQWLTSKANITGMACFGDWLWRQPATLRHSVVRIQSPEAAIRRDPSTDSR